MAMVLSGVVALFFIVVDVVGYCFTVDVVAVVMVLVSE